MPNDTSTTSLIFILFTHQGEWYTPLVLKKGGERIPQKAGNDYITTHSLAISGGGMKVQDCDSLDTGIREVREETGIQISRDDISGEEISFRGDSARPGYKYHRKVIYLSILTEDIDIVPSSDKDIEKTVILPLNELPIGPYNGESSEITVLKSHAKHIKNILEKNQSLDPQFTGIAQAIQHKIDPFELAY